jgi:opacity protein-like surface antigen
MEKMIIKPLPIIVATILAAFTASATAGTAMRFSAKGPVVQPKERKAYVFGYAGFDFGSDYETIGAFDGVPDPAHCPVGYDHSDPAFDPTNVPINFDLEDGETFGVGVGVYSQFLGGSRFELETSYTHNEVSGVTYVDFDLPASFDVETRALFFNYLKEVPLGKLTGYFGGGVGYANTSFRGDLDTVRFSDESDGFAWQLVAGVDFPLTDRLSMFTQYRYMVLSNQAFTTDFGDFTTETQDNPASHAVLLGARLSF